MVLAMSGLVRTVEVVVVDRSMPQPLMQLLEH